MIGDSSFGAGCAGIQPHRRVRTLYTDDASFPTGSCAVLCEGDPFFYGSFMYLHARLARECAVTIVPGVP